MRKILLLLVGTAVLCLPAVSVAGDSSKSPLKPAPQTCRSLHPQEGRQNFRRAYHSFTGCLKTERPDAQSDAKPNGTGEVSNPAGTCKSQRSEPNFAASHNGQSFTQFYGTNGGNGRGAGANAFGKCVSTTAKRKAGTEAKESAKGRVKDAAAPAMTCKAMKANDPAEFQATYGARPNAFGKCVAKQANNKS